MHQKDKLFFFNPRKLEGLLIQNRHVNQNLFILIRKSTSSGVNLNQSIRGLAFCFCKIIFTKGTKSCLAVLWEMWHWVPILPHIPSSIVLLRLGPEQSYDANRRRNELEGFVGFGVYCGGFG
jgi:hypothetical protein